MTAPGSEPTVRRLDFLPWEYAREASGEERERQAERHRELASVGKTELAASSYVAETAAVFCDELRLGERSYIGAHAYVTGSVTAGSDTTINPFAVVRGRITLGDGVRIGAHSSLIAFNHGTSPDGPIFRQPHTALGITVGDDVWIGSNVVVVDGITIGAHSIVGAGAVVTKNVDEYAVVVGNPARKLRDRRSTLDAPTAATAAVPSTAVSPGTASSASAFPDLAALAADFAGKARDQAGDVLNRCFDGDRFVDRPGIDGELVRPWCDAIEISDLLLRRAPEGHSTDDLVHRLQATELSVLDGPASYHVLCAGYALHLLGRSFEHLVDVHLPDLEQRLDALPWARNAWSAGAAIDSLGTAIARNLHDHKDSGHGPLLTLMGWLTARVDPQTGMWGQPHPDDGWLQVVNGFYRLTRGTYAQFGLPLPYPEAAIRTLLRHSQDRRVFSGDGFNACNVLDVIHPLWLAGKQTDYGRAEGRAWAERMLSAILPRWVDGAGFAFAPDGTDDRAIPGLQGTEMWLAIIWLLTEYLGFSDVLGYRPRGVHRPEPLITWQTTR